MENNYMSLEPSLEKQLKGHRKSITSLFYNPNEQQLASGSLDNSILVIQRTMPYYKGCFYMIIYFNYIIQFICSYGIYVGRCEVTDSKATMKLLWM